MACLVGIDLGTSSLKTMIMEEDGTCRAVAGKSYSIRIPQEGFAEQDPETWWQALVETMRQAFAESGVHPRDITGIGFSGQMHGMVLLDRDGHVIRPAILHCDQRSKSQVDAIRNVVGAERLARIAMNPIFPGFQIASLLWVRDNEPGSFSRIAKVLLPKDYLRYRLTGEMGTEPTDAASTLAFDITARTWSAEILDLLDLDPGIFPTCGETLSLAGKVTEVADRETSLCMGTPVVYGGGDQPMQALGNGLIEPGTATSTIGTGGQFFTSVDRPIVNPAMNTHLFNNVLPGTWYAMGAMMSAGLSLKWLRDNVLGGRDFKTLDVEAANLPACGNGLLFLPYLVGERTPHLDPNARGVFFGLTLQQGQAHLARAVMEGVTFALRDSFEIFKSLGIGIDRIIASGGGASSPLWLQIQADTYNRAVYTTKTVEQACTGAAMAAGLGCGVYRNVREACAQVVKLRETVTEPIASNVPIYEAQYGIYRELYARNVDLFRKIGSSGG